MKEKVIDFFNGIFVYERPVLKIEPEELVFDLSPGESARGSFVVSSSDERRIKGLVHARIPGMELLSDCFFARAARIEYTFTPQCLREGEVLEDRIWLETGAGEYRLPVKVRIRGGEEVTEEDRALPIVLAGENELPVCRTGEGRRESWKEKRRLENALAGIWRVLEEERRGALESTEAVKALRRSVEELVKADPGSELYPLLDVWVMLREGRQKDAACLLKKYEKARLRQVRNVSVQAVYLYVSGLSSQEGKETDRVLAQLRKLWQKYPKDQLVTAALLELDPQLRDSGRTRYLMLERQFRVGTRSRLLYQEAYALLEEDPALFTRLDDFTLQVFGRAAAQGILTVELAELAAAQATRIRSWSPLAARLFRTCYEIHPSKETAGAVCLLYIRGQRTDAEAFAWYERGVELDAKITSLYEYFIYAMPGDCKKLLPRQVLLYFQYHNTLNARQKTKVYCNLVRYGTPGEPVYEELRRQLQEFLLEQLKGRKVDDGLAWLYGKCLLPETLPEDLLEALADLLFLQKITCKERRIRAVEVCHAQLKEVVTVPLSGDCAYVPVYTKDARITLIDVQGGRHRRSVPYERRRAMIEPGFLKFCIRNLKDHLGLNLYLLDKEGGHRLEPDNLPLAWKLLEDRRVRETWAQRLRLEILDYERRHRKLDEPDERLMFSETEALGLSRAYQAAYIESLILWRQDDTALRLLWKSCCRQVEAGLLLRLLERLLAGGTYSRNLLLPLAWQVFREGVYTERVIRLLVTEGLGDTEELLRLWEAGTQFGMSLPELEERLLVQALFTEQYVCEVFPVYQSMDDRGGESVLGVAYLNYMGWLDFVKGQQIPEGVFDCLEHHLLWEDRLCTAAVLSYLRQLSFLSVQTDVRKRLARRLLEGLGPRDRRFSFMKGLTGCMGKEGRPWDQVVVEYRCDPKHRVILHYVLEYHGKTTFDYVTERLYPVCGGVFTRAFILFYGERLTWFVTETAGDGTEHSTECRTVENREETEGDSRFYRLCRMQQALDQRQEQYLEQMMEDYEELTELVEKSFRVR